MKANPKELIDKIEHMLMAGQEVPYALFMHRIHIIPIDHPAGGVAPAAAGMRPDGSCAVWLHMAAIEALSLQAATELLKHEVLHFVFGHVSSTSKDMQLKYGRRITNIAMDLVVNQHIREDLLRKEGLAGVTYEDYGFPPNLTTREYCERLVQSGERSEDSCYSIVSLTGSGEGTRLDVLVECDLPGDTVDGNIQQLLESVREEAEQKRRGSTEQARGWNAGEATEFIKQVKRKAQVPWQLKLRKLETSCLRSERILSRVRPSRRHPAHFGRIKKNGLHVWFAIDTSGSMGKEQLKLVDTEIRAIANRGATVELFHIDAGIAKRATYRPSDSANDRLAFMGRGGTDFTPLFSELLRERRQNRPGFIAYFTDGYGDTAEYLEAINTGVGSELEKKTTLDVTREPVTGIPVLWIIPGGCSSADSVRKNTKFGDIIVLPESSV